MLEGWHEFYGLLGTAAATLVALMFVAVSVAVGILTTERSVATRIYMSPIILHYACVMFVSLIAVVPRLEDSVLGAIIVTSGLVGLGYSVFLTVRLFRDGKSEFVDRFAYGAWPFCAYLGTVAGGALIADRQKLGPYVLAGAMLLLLLVNVRNAWDLTVTFARRHSDKHHNS
jgi:prepilin signal peptidase PulO-like enzyme (type II secretory pathway)